MSVNAELYKHLHGAAATDKNEDIKALEKYFHTRRENVAQVTVMPNFCIDEDMTYVVRRILKDKAEGLKVYRGLLVELRPNYTMRLSDLCFFYPQICKLRGFVELPDEVNLEHVKQNIQQINELDLERLVDDSEVSEEFAISPLYNSIGLYQSNTSNEEWGTSKQSNVLGYEISCDKYLMHFLILLLGQDLNVVDFHKRLLTTKVGASEQTAKEMTNDAARGIVEYIVGRDEDDCGTWLTESGTNWLYKNAQNYFFFNNCINLLALNKRPCFLQTAQVAGIQLYKTALTNAHKYNFAWPCDTGFVDGYHTDESLTWQQRKRLTDTFRWNRDKIPFNTSLMQKVNRINTSEWKQVEASLQVIPEHFYRVLFCRLSTHNVQGRLDARTLLALVPGNRETEIAFPLDKDHIVLETIVGDYRRVEKFAQIFNPRYYDKQKNQLKLPKGLAKIILGIQ